MTFWPRSNDPGIEHALDVIYSDYGVRASVVQKSKDLLKFGRNPSCGTSYETVWNQGGNETLITTNSIDTVSSSNAGDTQAIVVEGHTLANDNFTFVVQSATLNGQNKVVLSTPLARCSRVYNNDSTDFAGDIYCYEDDTVVAGVPQTAAKIHAKAIAGDNSTQKCATTLSYRDYAIITAIEIGVFEKTSASADFALQIRRYGKTFRTVSRATCSNESGGIEFSFYPYIIVPANSDVRIVAAASGASIDVGAEFQSILAIDTALA